MLNHISAKCGFHMVCSANWVQGLADPSRCGVTQRWVPGADGDALLLEGESEAESAVGDGNKWKEVESGVALLRPCPCVCAPIVTKMPRCRS